MVKIHRKTPLVILGTIAACYLIAIHFSLIINITPSMSEGFYIKSSDAIKRGDIVALCLTEPYKSIGLNNNYISAGQKCQGTDPLIKQIIAIPGDNVVLNNRELIINGRHLSYPTLFFDSLGRTLRPYPRGHYFNIKGYWVMGTRAVNSWDSRYWGEIKKEQILYKLWPVLISS